jgi:hypothetical protein
MTRDRIEPGGGPQRPANGLKAGLEVCSDGMLGSVLTTVRRRLRSRLPLLCVTAVLTSGLAFAPAALAATSSSGTAGSSGSFGELTKGGQESSTASTPAKTSTTSESSTTTSSSNSTSSSVLILALVAAGALLGGIAFVILRDARRVAPVGDGDVGGMGRSGHDPGAMMRKRRAKAKAARRQRKRNR